MTCERLWETGSFGFVDTDGLESRPAWLCDIGVESRYGEDYCFDNSKRPGYGGYLIQYTLAGRGWFEKRGRRHAQEEGTGFAVRFPEDSRYYLASGPGESWEFLYLHFDGAALRPYMDRLEELTGGVFPAGILSDSVRMFHALHRRLRGGGQLRKYEGGEFIFRFLCMLLREIDEAGDARDHSIVKRSIEIMEREYRELAGIRELAERLGISHEHFCRLFRREKNLSPLQYLTSLRIQSAMYDLLNTEEPLEAIAGRNGFSGANYFEKVFRKRIGVTPTQYRRQK